jgi:hypothetical protein
LRIERAIAADSADIGHALVEGGKSTILTITAFCITGAPRIVLGIGVCADPRDADENPGHEHESLHLGTPSELLRIETPDPTVLLSVRPARKDAPTLPSLVAHCVVA